MPVSFHNAGVDFSLSDKSLIRKWIKNEIGLFEKILGEISVVFCSDEYLLTLNQKYLSHDTYTDIITFDYSEGRMISGDIFISVERVIENSRIFDVNQTEELKRVIIHGILHLLGFEDSTEKEKAHIHHLEDEALTRFPGI